MPNISRILCPVDFSDSSQAALEYAEDFASWVGADLLLMHAFDQPASYDKHGQSVPADASVAKQFNEIKLRHDNVNVTRLLHAGTPGQVICWAAEHQNCNLIIMGTHGRTGLMHVLFGSTAEYVLQHARSPVLTIRPQDKDAGPLAEPIVTPMPAPRYL